MDKKELENSLKEWVDKVLRTYDEKSGMVDTLKMVKDVDEILALAFDHDKVIGF